MAGAKIILSLSYRVLNGKSLGCPSLIRFLLKGGTYFSNSCCRYRAQIFKDNLCGGSLRFHIRDILAILNNEKRIVSTERIHAGELILFSVGQHAQKIQAPQTR
jgi:hypothetical protein